MTTGLCRSELPPVSYLYVIATVAGRSSRRRQKLVGHWKAECLFRCCCCCCVGVRACVRARARVCVRARESILFLFCVTAAQPLTMKQWLQYDGEGHFTEEDRKQQAYRASTTGSVDRIGID